MGLTIGLNCRSAAITFNRGPSARFCPGPGFIMIIPSFVAWFGRMIPLPAVVDLGVGKVPAIAVCTGAGAPQHIYPGG